MEFKEERDAREERYKQPRSRPESKIGDQRPAHIDLDSIVSGRKAIGDGRAPSINEKSIMKSIKKTHIIDEFQWLCKNARSVGHGRGCSLIYIAPLDSLGSIALERNGATLDLVERVPRGALFGVFLVRTPRRGE